MSAACFVVVRPDGFIGVEIDAVEQLSIADARQLSRELARAADKAERLKQKAKARR